MVNYFKPTKHAARKWVQMHPDKNLAEASILFQHYIGGASFLEVPPEYKISNMLLRDDCKPTDFYFNKPYVFCVRDNTVITVYKELPAPVKVFKRKYGENYILFNDLIDEYKELTNK